MANSKLAVAVLVLMVSGAAAQVPGETAATDCPITDFSKVDWNTAKTACGECHKVCSNLTPVQLPRGCYLLLFALSLVGKRA
jgi:cytochrome c553